MDLTAHDLLDLAPTLADRSRDEAGSMASGDPVAEARARALDASGPLWPLALNGWMSLDRLSARLAKEIRVQASAEAAAVPAQRPGAAP
jgi:hypothetical protein